MICDQQSFKHGFQTNSTLILPLIPQLTKISSIATFVKSETAIMVVNLENQGVFNENLRRSFEKLSADKSGVKYKKVNKMILNKKPKVNMIKEQNYY